MPGNAASTGETWVLGAAPNAVAAPEKSFASAVTWAWTSSPMTTSHAPLRPSISCAIGTPLSSSLYGSAAPGAQAQPGRRSLEQHLAAKADEAGRAAAGRGAD